MTSHHSHRASPRPRPDQLLGCGLPESGAQDTLSMDFHLIANFAALALITLAGPAVIFILFYRRGAL